MRIDLVLEHLLSGALDKSSTGESCEIEWSIEDVSGIVCGDKSNFATIDSIELASLLVSGDDTGVSRSGSKIGDIVDPDVREAAAVESGALDAAVITVASCSADNIS